MEEKKGFLLKTVKQMNIGAGISAGGFLLYLAASALMPTIVADIISTVFGLIALYVWVSVWEGRQKDKETVSYSLLWGQSAVTLMLLACAVLAIRMRLGL